MKRFMHEALLAKSLQVSLFGGVVLALTLGSPGVVSADETNAGVFSIDSRPYGLTYGQWSEKWWQWAFSITTFDNCPDEPQSSPVFFLAAPTTSNCVIPANTAILFPTFNVEWSVVEAQAQATQPGTRGSCFVPTKPDGMSYAALLGCARAQANNARLSNATLEAVVDGRSFVRLTNYRAHSPPPPFNFTAATGNLFGLPAGISQSVADGFWIMLRPLGPGKHHVHFGASVPFSTVNPPATPFTFSTEADYCLIVQPSAQTCP